MFWCLFPWSSQCAPCHRVHGILLHIFYINLCMILLGARLPRLAKRVCPTDHHHVASRRGAASPSGARRISEGPASTKARLRLRRRQLQEELCSAPAQRKKCLVPQGFRKLIMCLTGARRRVPPASALPNFEVASLQRGAPRSLVPA